jgi:hypothetical protein
MDHMSSGRDDGAVFGCETATDDGIQKCVCIVRVEAALAMVGLERVAETET